MDTWKNASSGDRKRYALIAGALERHPDLLRLLFHRERAELVASPEALLQQTRAFSSGERVLIRAALDLWSDSGKLPLMDLCRLDPQNFRNVLAFVGLQHL
jgi:hypothetical protein